jgi:predicted nucleic acid-binding protein
VRSDEPTVAGEWRRAVAMGQIATCPVVKLEILHTARDGRELDEWDRELAALRDALITRSVTNAALSALRELAYVQPRYQRSVRLPDLLIAAAAQDTGLGVLTTTTTTTGSPRC